ncbi:apolipoprotein N-acyltransferase [Ruegeria lacuscaerulensis ITI-1157]|nr:apolipoprotein N-acyltransferase [Ruegeria lacuscaerulensis ITI-1157]SHI37883.1 Apolipoprotein N-acyltransferase [Ruegeria lacuscaerulensis ITI-1157]
MSPATRWPAWLRFACAFGLGVVAAFGLAPFGYWAATAVSLILIVPLYLSSETRARAAWMGWLFATGYFAHALSWIIEPFQVDAQRHAWMAPFALAFMSGGLALFWAAAFGLAYRGTGVHPVRRSVVLALCVALAEFARGYVLTGFPWAGIAQIWVDTPVAQLLSLVGPYGLGALTLLVVLPLGAVWAADHRLRSAVAPAIVVAAFSLASWTYAATRPSVSETDKTVRLIQPNAPQHQKWDPAFAPLFFARQVEFTAAEPRPDLIVWPETSVPAWLGSAQPYLQAIAAAAQGSPVFVGIQRGDGPRIYNSLIYLDERGVPAGLYDKHHLVPFGEYIPLGDLLGRFGISGLAATTGSGFSAGPGPRLMQAGTIGAVLPLICYEAIFPQITANAPARPALFLQVTNDAWFGTKSGPFQHLAQARMRAIEQGVPLARAANTGVSAMIDPLGEVTEALPLGQAGYVDARIPAPLMPTLYSRMGDVPVLLILSILLLLARNVLSRKR